MSAQTIYEQLRKAGMTPNGALAADGRQMAAECYGAFPAKEE